MAIYVKYVAFTTIYVAIKNWAWFLATEIVF